jgi:enoyl-[acyl-carrier protein] reductase I
MADVAVQPAGEVRAGRLLEGKRALVTGVANKRSIAWGIASAFGREGAELAFAYQGERLKENVLELARSLPDGERIPVLPCDVSRDEDIRSLFQEVERRWGRLDVLVHSIGYAPVEELKGRFIEVTRDGLRTTIEISAYSLVALCRAALPLFERAGGASVISLTYNAVERVVPSYNAMALAKAVLETATRYLAADLGPANVRVNAISSGPIRTLAASAVRGISQARDLMESKAPLRRNVTQDEVGNVAAFLASDMARCVTGATIFADNGYHILGVTE